MPFYEGTRRSLLSGAGRYPSKSFASGVQQVTTASFSFSAGSAEFTFNSGVTGGSPTQWDMFMNAGNSITPGDGFSFQYDGFNTAQFWFQVDGNGSGSGTQVTVSSGDTADQVCSALASVANQPGVYQSSSSSISYTSTNYESQSTPSSGSYGFVNVINYGSPDPGLVAQISCTYISFGVTGSADFYAAYSNGSGSGTSVATLNGNYTADQLATLFVSGITNSISGSYFSASSVGPVLTVTATQQGQVPDSTASVGSISVVQLSSGYAIQNWPNSAYILTTEPVSLETYYVWCQVNGSGSDPVVGDHGNGVILSSFDSPSTIASAIAAGFYTFGIFNVNSSDGFIQLQQGNVGPSTPASGSTPPFTISTPTVGVVNVNTSTDTITVPGYLFPTGLSVRLSTTSALPGGLSLNTTYYVIRVTANTLRLASSRANALAGTPVNLTDVGLGTQTIYQYP